MYVAAWKRPSSRVFSSKFGTLLAGAGAGRHVVPLQNLMQDDSVEESPQAQAKQNTRCRGKPSFLLRHHPTFVLLTRGNLQLRAMFLGASSGKGDGGTFQEAAAPSPSSCRLRCFQC